MGIDDLTAKAKEFLADNRVSEALKSEQAEDVSDKLLDSVADAANKATGGKFEDKIADARDAADKAIGNE
ncbi:Rv0909 family putative TA system antitoxin [Leucobacter sp. NPDC077196]|uniref:Rv0909 family putative TA system antitoxin n=1 Tax=Leucobacter sp. NPDC077196 TaxID=3154959 RepID=UPI003427E9A3